MNKWKAFLICLLGALTLSATAAPKEKKEKVAEPQRVYMYGMSVNHHDSTVYITDVQDLDDIIINTDGSLQNYAGYSMQLKVYLEGTLGNVNQTCAVVYSYKKKKLEKRFIKTKKKFLANKDQVLRQIGTDTFTFQKR